MSGPADTLAPITHDGGPDTQEIRSMTDATATVTATEFEDADGLAGWRVLSDGGFAFYRTASFEESARFVAAVSGRAGVAAHPPALDVRPRGVTVKLITSSTDYMGMSRADIAVALEVEAAAAELGLVADPAEVQSFLVIPGAPTGTEILPFWRAVLGYEPRADSPDEDLVDPHDRDPAFWFEGMDEPRGDGGGAIHVAVWLPAERAQARIEAALAAGGRIVRDQSPRWVTLADAAGNEVDVATVSGRD
jgi:4a-hydroxytetrahydrobiopterin dehydratase